VTSSVSLLTANLFISVTVAPFKFSVTAFAIFLVQTDPTSGQIVTKYKKNSLNLLVKTKKDQLSMQLLPYRLRYGLAPRILMLDLKLFVTLKTDLHT
jgi:hypothetical protein